MSRTRSLTMFLAMCVVWGLTWIAIKTGLALVPPLFFAGTRFLAAGLILLAWERWRAGGGTGSPALPKRQDWPLILGAAMLLIVATYSLLFWGMERVASGLSAVLNLALMPIGLFVMALAYREERFDARRLLAIAIGIIGLAVLFRPGAGRGTGELLGMAAIIAGTLAYCWGSVLSRSLLRRYTALTLSGLACLVGGVILLGLSAVVEPISMAMLAAFARPAIAASWLFLVLFGSLVAFTIYLRLVLEWGASRAGLYAFVSPVIAVAVGVLLSGETLRTSEAVGMAMMLAATAFALGRGDDRLAAEKRNPGSPRRKPGAMSLQARRR